MEGTPRIRKFAQGLKEAGVDAALLSYPVDVYYLAGTAQPCTLIVPADGEPLLLVNRNLEGARRETWVKDVRDSLSFKDIRTAITDLGHHEAVIGICGDVLPSNTYARLQEFFPKARLVDVSMVLRRTRMIKDQDEIRLIRESARISDVGHQAARKYLRPGVSELQVTSEIELDMVIAGGDGFILPRNLSIGNKLAGTVSAASAYRPGGLGVAVCGEGSHPILPFGPSKRILEKGDVVIVDLCGVYNGYATDHSRPYVLGTPTAEQVRIVRALKGIVERGLDLLRPGSKACDVFSAVSEFAVEAGYGEWFLGPKERNIRFVGHGLGLELDELPVLFAGDETVLAEGMVIAFEPILLIPDVAVATMENTVLITADGHEVLTTSPMDLTVL
ncbi:MAG: Xaa-Pro peptidase family protein [Chloroflexi bacterium]|nr:Xaa-Pro peptidase family protein [Chloroflexota bacterium]